MILNLKNNLFNTDPLLIYQEYGISNKEWNKIQADQEYEIKNKKSSVIFTP